MSGETRIRVLGDAVINKIAAGEVVDRPASVVKELVENSLDAGATHIEVEVVGGGRTLIAVTDDGEGMSRDDALLSIERHATSKIRDVADIEHIATLGFRGEALAAIAAVTRLTLQTARRGDPEGTELTVHGGRLMDVRGIGAPAGTRVVARNLFFNVPARRRFLRTEATELAQVRQTLLPYALSRPDVGFRFVADGREVWRLAAGESLFERLAALYGEPVAAALRPVKGERGSVHIEGWAGLPQTSRADRAEVHLFVNRRPAGAPVLQHALNEAYQTLLPRGRYPMVVLFIELPPEEVDVNVHPTKREVRFRRPGDVRDALIESVRAALGRPAAGAPAAPSAAAAPAMPESWTHPRLSIPDLPPARAFVYPRWTPPAPAATAPSPPPTPSSEAVGTPWSWCRVVGQVGGLFVVLETEDGLVVMDPHAAHERVLYDRLMREATRGQVRSQPLLVPETVELGAHDAELVRGVLPALREMGFGVAEFGGDAFVVDAVPAVLGDVVPAGLLPEIAATLERGGSRGGTERWIQDRIATAACRAAVKARDILKLEEIERLVVELAGTDMPYTCPHGRPTLIHFDFAELRRKFGRE
ncbi:MAG: DNA mismatch repair endonuclease MutL [Kiritimatiellae bacterium]|nr:DNA mismatch repair endonuclease MutL [Kiritimatiellia bacterium]